MKILHVISQPPDFTGSGKVLRQIIFQSRNFGHENFLLAGVEQGAELLPALVGKDHCLSVHFGGPDLPFTLPGMSDIMPYPSRRFSSLTAEEIDQYRQVFTKKIHQAIDRFHPDILHTHHLWMVSALVRSAGRQIPMVTTCHGTCLRQHHLCPELGRTLLEALRQIDRVISLSQDQKQTIVDSLGIAPDVIAVISGGVDQTCFFHVPKRCEGTVHLVYAGKLSTAKGLPWLLSSLEKLGDLPFQLHIAGTSSGPEQQMCLDLAGRLGAKALCYGALSHEDLGKLMQKAHIFVLPSFFEGLPLVLMEAAACGCKIITTSLGGVREIFGTGENPMVEMIDLPS